MAKSKTKRRIAPRLQIITRSRRKSCPTLRHYDRNATLGPVVQQAQNRPTTRKFSESDKFAEKMEFDEQTDEDDAIHGTMWEVLPSLALIRIFDKINRTKRQSLFLVSRHWNNHLNWPRLWRNYEFIVTADEEIPTKAWKNCNQYLTQYGQHVRNLKVRFDFDQENRPIHNIQNFLSIFKVIMSKLIKKSAQLETIDISEFRFGFNECWDAMVARSWATRREYAQQWSDYLGIFIDLLYTFLQSFNRSRLRSIKMRNMHFGQFVGLQILEGFTRPCEEDLERYDVHEFDLVNFFEEQLYPTNQCHLNDRIEVLAITIFRVDGDMIDEGLLRALGNGSGRSLEHLEIDIKKQYRDTHFPVNSDGTVTEPLSWSFIESRCVNLKLTARFSQSICEHRSVNSFVAHFIKNSTRVHALHFEREDVRKIPAAYRAFGRYPYGSHILLRNLSRHYGSLKKISIQMVDHTDTELQSFFTDLITQQTQLDELRITAFLTREFSLELMKAIRAKKCPVSSLFIRAYSFESDKNFISKTLLNKEYRDVIQSLSIYDVVSYSRPDRLRTPSTINRFY